MKQTIILLLLVVGIFTGGKDAQALSCVPSPGPEVEFEQAQAVFVGEATHAYDDKFTYGAKNYAKFRVDKVYKGELPANLTIETDQTWGMRFEAGKSYLVYLDGMGPYTVELCRFGTTLLSDAQAAERISQIEAAGHHPREPQLMTNEPGSDGEYRGYLRNLSYGQRVILHWLSVALLMGLGYLFIKNFYK